jgi:TldD protein
MTKVMDPRERVESALRKCRARWAEVRLEETTSTSVAFRAKALDQVTESVDRGGFVRVLAPEGGFGSATFNDWDQLERKLGEALECARAVPSDRVELAEVAAANEEIRPPLGQDFRAVSLADKVGLVRELNDVMLGAPEIRSTRAVYRDRMQTVYYGNTQGAWIVEERPLIDLYCVAEAVRGNDVQMAIEADTIASKGFEAVRGKTEYARKAAMRARELLDAKPVKGGVYTVIADPSLSGVFVHEAFGHLSEADFQSENPDMQKMMTPGRKFGRDILSIADSGIEDPTAPGSHRFDDEGVPMRRTQLVKEGHLVGRLHSRETAAKLKEEPTGSARAQDFRHAPIVRMRNTFIEPGTTKLEEMISDVKLGIYACKSSGGQTCLGDFSFSSAYAYMIRDGKKAEMVKDVVLSGNIFESLANVTAIGDDFKWENAGRCGKAGQAMPVGMGSPHIKIENVVVGGA